MAGALTPATHMSAALDRMLAFVESCPDRDWYAQPLTGSGDPRAVGVIADHVADAYEYLGGWIREIIAGGDPQVDAAVVDGLNAAHASKAQLTQAAAADHLRRSGSEFISLISALSADELAAGGGRAGRLAEIAAVHTDSHRGEIQAALGN